MNLVMVPLFTNSIEVNVGTVRKDDGTITT